jgi:DNA-binding response OmpR family regulator
MAHILVIDDDLDIVDNLKMILEANDHTVSVKTDADDVVNSALEVNPDLIILDIIFPEDPNAGFVAARDLQKNDKVKHIPVLLLSAVNQQSRMSFGFSETDISEDYMPVEAFLEKPVEPSVLLAKIRELLGNN